MVESKQDEERIYAPINYANKKFLAQEERFRLLITTNKKGVKNASVIHYIADNTYFNKNKRISTADFTGIILVQDLNGNFIYGLRYKNAKIIGALSPSTYNGITVDNKKANKNQPGASTSNSSDCTILTVVYYSQSCSGGNYNDPVENYTEEFTYCTSGGDGSNPGGDQGDPLGGGGGNGGGGSGVGCGDAILCPDGTPNASLEMGDGFLVPLQISTSPGGISANHIEATLKLENNQITGVTSHMAGLTGGATYVQTDWVQNSEFNNVYTFSFAFHTNFAIPIFGIGNLGSDSTAIAHCTYDLVTKSLAVFFEKAP